MGSVIEVQNDFVSSTNQSLIQGPITWLPVVRLEDLNRTGGNECLEDIAIGQVAAPTDEPSAFVLVPPGNVGDDFPSKHRVLISPQTKPAAPFWVLAFAGGQFSLGQLRLTHQGYHLVQTDGIVYADFSLVGAVTWRMADSSSEDALPKQIFVVPAP